MHGEAMSFARTGLLPQAVPSAPAGGEGMLQSSSIQFPVPPPPPSPGVAEQASLGSAVPGAALVPLD